MTTRPSLPSLVLRGSGATARFEDGSDHVRWETAASMSRIPLEAIEEVRGSGRTIELVLTTADADRLPAVYAVHDVSAAAVAAFTAAVRARLPERAPDEPRAEGEGLITTVPARTDRGPSRRTVLIVAVIAVVAAMDVTVGVRREWEFVALLLLVHIVTAAGLVMVIATGQGLYYGRRLPKHGITVMAELDHHTHNTKVYRYTDLDGVTHFYRDPLGGQRLELSYDPRRPGRAATRIPVFLQCMMALVTVLGVCFAGGGLGFTLYQFGVALTG
ncbi:DUF3592 domain-containing protein [Streptomyces poonensis]|uniref:DUF3592 domain-containing protein n=1 Tax=Streptomyces poonensis TaxID=68255 RepID=UPI00167B9D38|nr:DUF3592 domain-containing protein [Streptomyces poonensis]